MQVETMRCPRCSKEVADSSRFCRRCGCAFGGSGMSMPPPAPPIREIKPEPRVTKSIPRPPVMPPAIVPPPPVQPKQTLSYATAAKAKPAVKSSGGGGWVVLVLIAVGTMARMGAFSNKPSTTTTPFRYTPPPTFNSSGFYPKPITSYTTPGPTPLGPTSSNGLINQQRPIPGSRAEQIIRATQPPTPAKVAPATNYYDGGRYNNFTGRPINSNTGEQPKPR